MAGGFEHNIGHHFHVCINSTGKESTQSPNAKVVVLPADLQETLRGVLGKLGGR